MSGENLDFLDTIVSSVPLVSGIMGLFIFFLQYYRLPVLASVPLGIVMLLFSIYQIIKKLSLPKSAMGIILLIFCLYIIGRSLFLPIAGWDTYSLYDARAKMFLSGETYKDFNNLNTYDTANATYYFSYPPMTSNLHLWAYLTGLSSPMIIYALFYITYFCTMVYWIGKSKLPLSLKILSFVASSFHPLISRHINSSYTNLPMLTFQMAAVHNLLKYYYQDNRRRNLVYFCLMLVFSVWTRMTEPTFIAFIIALGFVVFQKKYNLVKKLFYILIPLMSVLLIRNIWSNFSVQFGVPLGALAMRLDEGLLNALMLGQLLNVAQYFWLALSPINLLIYLPLVFIIYNFFFNKSLKSAVLNPVFIIWITILLIMFSGTIYTSAYYVWWNKIPDSLLRTSLILIPISVLYFVLNIYPALSNEQTEKT